MHTATRPAPRLRHSLPWLVCLALLLPLAQIGATWHGYSHAVSPASGIEGKQLTPHSAYCDLCLAAAAISGGVLLGAQPGLQLAAVHHPLPALAARSLWLAPATLAYRSRAPPRAPR